MAAPKTQLGSEVAVVFVAGAVEEATRLGKLIAAQMAKSQMAQPARSLTGRDQRLAEGLPIRDRAQPGVDRPAGRFDHACLAQQLLLLAVP